MDVMSGLTTHSQSCMLIIFLNKSALLTLLTQHGYDPLPMVCPERFEVLAAVKIVDGGLLSCDTMWTCKWVPAFQRNILSASSKLTSHSVTTQKTTIDI
jgi:hypothetical protein